MDRKKIVGSICGIMAAVCYGTNPLGALNLYGEGMATGQVLFYRFALAWVVMAVVMAVRRESLRLSWKEFGVVTALGLLFIGSSLTLYISFTMMAAGVASTILFTYPVMTAVIMVLVFGEKMGWRTIFALVLSLAGVVLLYWGDGGERLPVIGVILVLASALTYALYIIVVDRSKITLSSFKINFYVLFYCAAGMAAYALISGQGLILPPSGKAWFWVGWLAVVPAIMALCLMVYSAKYIGSTATAIIGALEPLTAVVIGVAVFGEAFGLRLAVGIVLIVGAVVLTVLKATGSERKKCKN